MTHRILLSGDQPRGTIIPDSEARRLIGTCTLPIEPGNLGRHGVSGFMERHWGKGVPLTNPMPSAVCPMALYLVGPKQHTRIYWTACLELLDRLSPFIGSIRLATQTCAMLNVCGLGDDAKNGVSFSKLQLSTPDDAHPYERAFASGSVPISLRGDGMISLTLHGYGNARVIWSAVSQAE